MRLVDKLAIDFCTRGDFDQVVINVACNTGCRSEFRMFGDNYVALDDAA